MQQADIFTELFDRSPESKESTNCKLTQAIRDAGLGNILGLFDRMEIAEEEIEKAKSRYPDRTEQIHDAFQYLCPPPGFESYADVLYRAFCTEILDRIGVGEKNIEFGTNAEVCVMFCEMCLKSPIVTDAYMAYKFCFEAIFGRRDIFVDFRESYDGAVSEIVSRVKNKLSRSRS